MKNIKTPLSKMADDCLFLVWGPPSHGPRSKVLAKELGINQLHFVHLSKKRGLLSAPFRYAYQAFRTLQLLFQMRPKIVFVQSPPSFAPLTVLIYCMLTHSRFFVDAHSSAFLLPFWMKPDWVYRHLARKAIATIVTNEHFQQIIANWGANSFLLRDIPTNFSEIENFPLNGGFNVTVVNTFSPDEPLEEILSAAELMKDVNFFITGNLKLYRQNNIEKIPGNVHFTDYLPNDRYYGLMSASNAVLCLTTRDHTMQRGACEALSMGKPIITSDWPLLREYFSQGTVHVDNNCEGILEGITKMRENYDHYQEAIKELQISRKQEWEKKLIELSNLVEDAFQPEL